MSSSGFDERRSRVRTEQAGYTVGVVRDRSLQLRRKFGSVYFGHDGCLEQFWSSDQVLTTSRLMVCRHEMVCAVAAALSQKPSFKLSLLSAQVILYMSS